MRAHEYNNKGRSSQQKQDSSQNIVEYCPNDSDIKSISIFLLTIFCGLTFFLYPLQVINLFCLICTAAGAIAMPSLFRVKGIFGYVTRAVICGSLCSFSTIAGIYLAHSILSRAMGASAPTSGKISSLAIFLTLLSFTAGCIYCLHWPCIKKKSSNE